MNALRILGAVVALLVGLLHLFFALLAGSRDTFHLDAPPPGLREHLTVAALAALGLSLMIGGVVALSSLRHARAAFRTIALVLGIDAVGLFLVQASRGRPVPADLEHLFVLTAPAALAVLYALLARRDFSRGASVLLLAGSVGALLSCSSPAGKSNERPELATPPRPETVAPQKPAVPMPPPADLVLKVSVEPAGAIGYADLFRCQVRQVLKGKLGSAQILMTILPSDPDRYAFFLSHKTPAEIEVGFDKNAEGEPYGTTAINGFVDDNKTSWRLVYAR